MICKPVRTLFFLVFAVTVLSDSSFGQANNTSTPNKSSSSVPSIGDLMTIVDKATTEEAKGKDWSAVVSDFQKSLRDAKKSAIPIRDVLKQAGKDFTADRIYLKILKIIRSAEDESKKELAKAFKESFSALKKMREASILEAKGHKWKYQDSRGVWQTGEFLKFSDKGGTDITYFFKRDKTGETDLVSGSRLKKAKKL